MTLDQRALEAAREEYFINDPESRFPLPEVMTAAIQAYEKALWQPIETVTDKVGTDFLAISKSGSLEHLYYDDEGYATWEIGRLVDIDDYSMWRPLPPMPEGEV